MSSNHKQPKALIAAGFDGQVLLSMGLRLIVFLLQGFPVRQFFAIYRLERSITKCRALPHLNLIRF